MEVLEERLVNEDELNDVKQGADGRRSEAAGSGDSSA